MSKRNLKNELLDLLRRLLVLSAFSIFFLIYFSYDSFKIASIVTGSFIGLVFGLIYGITYIQNKKYDERLKKSGIHDIDKMTGRQFEYYLKLLYVNNGYFVKETRITGDYGADLVLEKNGKKIVIQAKRHSKNVGLKAVQEAQTAKAYYGATEAWVVSNRDYTKAAYNLAKSNNVTLINRKQLIDMILQLNPGDAPDTQKVIEDLPVEEVICNRCGNPMVLRSGPRGEFYGCSTFPRCRNTKAIDFS